MSEYLPSDGSPLSVVYGWARPKLQLWDVSVYGLIGSVVDKQGNLLLIPGNRIENPLCSTDSPSQLRRKLSADRARAWDLIYDVYRRTLIIWPHLVGAGGGKPSPKPIVVGNTRVNFIEEKALKRDWAVKPLQRGRNPKVYNNRVATVYFDRFGEGRYKREMSHVDVEWTGELKLPKNPTDGERRLYKELNRLKDKTMSYEEGGKTKSKGFQIWSLCG